MHNIINKIIVISVFVLGSVGAFSAQPIKFEDIRDKVFTNTMKMRLVEWEYDVMKVGNNGSIYSQIRSEMIKNSEQIEDKYIMSYDDMRDRCMAFIEVFNYKHNSGRVGGMYLQDGNCPDSKVCYVKANDRHKQLVLIIGGKAYGKRIY